ARPGCHARSVARRQARRGRTRRLRPRTSRTGRAPAVPAPGCRPDPACHGHLRARLVPDLFGPGRRHDRGPRRWTGRARGQPRGVRGGCAMTVNVGVIGTGMMGAAHARTLASAVAGARVAAVSDADEAKARGVAHEIDDRIRLYADHVELINDADVDAVLVVSPDHTHEALTIACVEAGKPVLCEKPLAATAEDCLRVVGLEQAKGRRLVQLGYMRRFDPAYVDMQKVLDSGEIGRPLLTHCAHRNAVALPFFTSEMPITNSAVHEIDAARWLLSEEITRVTAHMPRTSGLASAELTDPRLVVLETASGVVVDVEVFVNAQYGYDVRCEVVAEQGTVSLSTPSRTVLRRENTEGARVHEDF